MTASPNREIGDHNATAMATLVDEWVRCGVAHAVVAPGSRSTPLALALAARPEIVVHIVLDERAAGFVALGLGLDGDPAIVLCTSGTAAANLHPAVVEAGLSDVPMIVCTADRPPELRGVGAPQTIDQLELYGRSVRWFHDARVPDEADPATWRPLAQRVYATSLAGPVHLNLPFREPLLGVVGALPEPVGPALPIPRARAVMGPVDGALDRQRGIIIAGGRSGEDPAEVLALAERVGWPILADPLGGMRDTPASITAFDALLRHRGFADAHAPEVIVRVGRPPASKVLSQWIVSLQAPVLQVGGPGKIDPEDRVVGSYTLADLAGLSGAAKTPWLARWTHANERAETQIEAVLADAPLSEPGLARLIAEHLADEVGLVVSSSMPVRDLEWFGGPRARAHANRGANGIDGVIATALGRVLLGQPTVLLIGDIAFVHDASALTGLAQRASDLRIIVIDNGGGGIFSFLPQAAALPPERFEQLFGTPHGTDIVGLARAHGVAAHTATEPGEVLEAIARPGPSVTRVVCDRHDNVAIHERLNAAVAAGLR